MSKENYISKLVERILNEGLTQRNKIALSKLDIDEAIAVLEFVRTEIEHEVSEDYAL